MTSFGRARWTGRLCASAAVLVLALAAVRCGSGTPTLPPAPTPSPSPERRKPNIVFILADDLDARPFETIPGFMPHLRELVGKQGVTFSRSYTSSPLCCPARVSILTGQYPHNTGIVDNDPPDGGFRGFYRSGKEQNTVATMLKAAGYRTVLLGKYLNGYASGAHGEYVPPGWDEWFVSLTLGTYFEYYMNSNGSVYYFGAKEEDYVTDVMTARSVDFIRRASSAADPQPFFMHISVLAPHRPASAAPRHGAEFRNMEAPEVPSFDEEDISDKPSWVLRKTRFDSETLRILHRLYRRRLQSMLAVDDLIARVVQALAQANQLEDTYIFFSSDNGWQTGEHRYQEGKALMYEESIRVPLLVRGPGVTGGVTLDHLVSNVDLLPTWLELARAPLPSHLDGRSLAPLLTGRPLADPWRQEVLFEFLATGSPESPPFYGLRTAGWAYASYEGGERELYDMRTDPYQLENVGYKALEVRGSLDRRLEVLSKCAGPSCR